MNEQFYSPPPPTPKELRRRLDHARKTLRKLERLKLRAKQVSIDIVRDFGLRIRCALCSQAAAFPPRRVRVQPAVGAGQPLPTHLPLRSPTQALGPGAEGDQGPPCRKRLANSCEGVPAKELRIRNFLTASGTQIS